MTRKQILIMVVLAFFVGAIGSIVFDRIILPYLSTLPGLSGLRNFQSNSPIVINRTEQIQLDDGVNMIELTKQAQNYTVSIYSNAPDIRLLGSGTILTSDGLIFTSRAVLGNLTEVTVILNDGRSFPGLVRAMDRKSEIAVVTIIAQNLSVAQFEDANNLQTAARIMALGKSTNQFTRQFVSGVVTRSVNNFSSLEQVYSTEELSETFGFSAALNSDYVGGPVFNLDGRMVGMVANASGKIITAEGLSQALNEYLSSGKVIRPYAGIRYLNFSSSLANLKKLPGPGVQVVSIEEASPARAAGLRVGDFITAVDNTNIETLSFERLINRHQPGEVKLSVRRGDSNLEIRFNIQEQ